MNRCGNSKQSSWLAQSYYDFDELPTTAGVTLKVLSDFTTLKCGVPQGRILGPLLFRIFINDLPNCLWLSVPRMYADDTHITYVGSDLHLIQSCLSHDLEKPSIWLAWNRLTLNATKTEFMPIGSRKRLTTLLDTHNSAVIMFCQNKFPLWNSLEYNPWLSNMEWDPHWLT